MEIKYNDKTEEFRALNKRYLLDKLKNIMFKEPKNLHLELTAGREEFSIATDMAEDYIETILASISPEQNINSQKQQLYKDLEQIKNSRNNEKVTEVSFNLKEIGTVILFKDKQYLEQDLAYTEKRNTFESIKSLLKGRTTSEARYILRTLLDGLENNSILTYDN